MMFHSYRVCSVTAVKDKIVIKKHPCIADHHSYMQYLVLEQGPPKGPNCSKDEIDLINFLGTVCWGVFWS